MHRSGVGFSPHRFIKACKVRAALMTIAAMSFEVEIGLALAQGPRDSMDDFAAVQRPGAGQDSRGWIAAVADGVSEGGDGRMAAQTLVMSLVQDFYAAPASWDTTVVLDRLISAQNAWLAGHNRRAVNAGTERSALTTLSCVVLRGHSFTIAHVGDSRIYLLRGDECLQLTQDHALEQSDFARLTRAIGLDDVVRIDYEQGELRVGDRLLLTSDGVHGVLPHKRLVALARSGDAQAAADALVLAATAGGGRDNATALVLQVQGLASGEYEDVIGASQRLPIPAKLRNGERIDGMEVLTRVADNGVNRLYQVRRPDGSLAALKTLHESRASDPTERTMLAHEGWLGQRLGGDGRSGFVRAHEPQGASAFYLLFDWLDGRTMEALSAEQGRPSLEQFLAGAIALTGAVGRLHRAGVIHRDIKPANLHLGEDGRWRLLDLGVALSGREPEALRELHAGTPSYINPEQWGEPPAAPDAGSDLYALGVTLYQWLLGRLPYGEIEPYQTARFRRDPQAPSRIRPEVPIWLDHLLLKAVNREAALRFETAEEMLLALERGASRPLLPVGVTPLARRNPLALWQIALAVSLLFNALLLYWLFFLPR